MAALHPALGRPELAPALIGVGVFVALAAAEAGGAATSWYPAALFLLGVAVIVVAFRRRNPAPIGRATALALLFIGAFTAWSFVSIIWADVKGDAWDGANRTALYALVFALFALPSWNRRSAAIVLGAYSLGIAGLATVTALALGMSDDPELAMISGRLTEPAGYHNAAAALFIGGSWPALFLASRRETPWPLRGVFLSAAGVLVQLAVLPQSRGAAIAFPLALVVYIAVVPGRARTLIAIALVGLAGVFAAGPLLDVHRTASEGGDLVAAIDGALAAVWISAAVLAIAGASWGVVERRLEVPQRVARTGSRAMFAAAGAAATVAAVLALGAVGNPVSWGEERWQDFKAGYETEEIEAEVRFTGGLGSNRYDFWRVALKELADSPILGTGTESFAVAYLRERESDEEPLHPHSLPVRVLSQTGIVGAALFLAFLVSAGVAAAAARARTRDRLARGSAAVAIVAVVYWFGHSAGDWFWPLPAITAPAIAWLALAGGIAPRRASRRGARMGSDGPTASSARRRAPAIVVGGLGALAALALAVSFTLPWMAARDVDVAASTWHADSPAAFDRLERAAGLNPLSAEPYVIAGAIASRLGDIERMRESFEAAIERNEQSWYAWLELGAAHAVEDRRPRALEALGEALRLNPADEVIARTLRRVGARRDVSLRALDRAFTERVCARVGRTRATPDC